MRKAKGMVSTTSQMTAHDDDGDPFTVLHLCVWFLVRSLLMVLICLISIRFIHKHD